MDANTIGGEGRDLGGKVKETVGDATGDSSLKAGGLADQISGKVEKTFGSAKDAVSGGVGPLADQAKRFAKDRPFATAALVGTIALAVINTLRGKK